MSKRFAAAKWHWATIITLHVPLLAGPFVSATASSRLAAIAVGLGVLVIPPVAFLLKWKAEEHYTRAEEVRRMLFLQDSVGQEVPENERLLIELESRLLPALEPACIGTYYASQSVPGLRRLVEKPS